MAHYTILFSPTGGTKNVADILAGELSNEQTIIDLCDPSFAGASLTAEDVAIIAIPSYGGRVPGLASRQMVKINGNGAQAILVCVYGNRAYDDTLAELKYIADWCGFGCIAAVAAVAEHSVARKVAAGRPDADDVQALKNMASKIREKMDANRRTAIQVPGKEHPEPAPNFGGKMAPKCTDNCIHCGICAEKCPTQAIDPETLEADKGTCIGCMRCISVCPSGARKMNIIIESLGGVALSVLCSQRKENELFL